MRTCGDAGEKRKKHENQAWDATRPGLSTRNKKLLGTRASLLLVGARTLLGAPGMKAKHESRIIVGLKAASRPKVLCLGTFALLYNPQCTPTLQTITESPNLSV